MELSTKYVSRKLLTPTFICLWIIMFLVEFVKGALIVAILPVYMGDVLQLSAFAIGLSFSMQYIGDNFFRSPAGWLIERLGFRFTMAMGLAITFGAVLMIAFMQTMGFIVLGCALLGIGTAPLWPCVLMGISAVTEESKNFGTAMGVIQISSLGGTGSGPIIINFFVEESFRPVFWFLIGCTAFVLIVSLLLPGRSPDTPSHSTGDKTRIGAQSVRNGWDNFKQTYKKIRQDLNVSRLLYPALFLQTFAVGLLTPVITLYVRSELGLPPETYSAMMVAGGGVTVLGLIPIGKLVDKFGTKWFLHTGFLLATLTIGAFAVTRSIPIVWVLVIMVGLSYAFILPTWDTMISYMLPQGEKGTVWGFFLTIQGFGMVVGPIVSGRMWDILGPSAPFFASSAAMAALFCIHVYISRRPIAS